MFCKLAIPLLVFFTLVSADEKKPEKDPNVIFDSESDSAQFATISGIWKSFEDEGEKMIRLSPEPIRDSRVDIGPILPTYNITVTAKVLAKEKGRLKPMMGVGIFGDFGITLRVAPARKKLELVQYGEIIADAPCEWVSARWFFIELTMKAQATAWRLEGKIWDAEKEKPEAPTLIHEALPASMTHQLYGRAFLTGAPYTGLPIFYDKVTVRKN
ncbi:MAG: hypothetical protein P1U89_20225 [Verrucomicrobiales bacterium]|nr:hypothetical protein [Verrucomicrobiales bacterium]